MTELEEKDLQQVEEKEEILSDVAADNTEVEEATAPASEEEKPKKKLGEKWQEYVEKHPKLENMATYVKEHKTMLQAILFMVFSCLAFVAQLGTQALFDWALKDVGQVVKVWPFPEQALGTLISFLIANVVAKVISFVMNRKKTFNANNNKIFSAVTYTIMVVTLIIVETLVGEPLAKALNTASNGVLGDWSNTLAIILYSIPDFIIVFLMDKFVIMRHKEEKKEESTEAQEDNQALENADETTKAWEKFEIECTNFLKEQFGDYAKFTRQGGSDSTIPDIKVETKNKQFYIEAKHCPAQCGQFVLLPNIETQEFEYSRANSTEINEFSQAIVEHMNNNFEEFKEAGTAGKIIEFDDCEVVFNKWIIKVYKEKGVEYFITNEHVILPNIDKVSAHIKSILPDVEIRADGAKIFINAKDDLHNQRFVVDGNEYMISKRASNFEVRKLSNTFNANVIFSIEFKTDKKGMSIDEFIVVLVN